MSDTKIVFSLATYGKRLEKLRKTLPTVCAQSLKADAIVVNVQDDCTAEVFDEFKRLAKELKDDRIVVKSRPAKWRSFNKYLHVYSEYRHSVIVTFDDDIMYGADYARALFDEWFFHPDCIVCHEINPMLIDGGGIRILNSIDVKLRQREFGKYLTGCCLFPPDCFDRSEIPLDDYDRFMELTNGVHDEIWLWTLSTLLGIRCIGLDWTYSFDLDGCSLPPEDTALCHINGKKENILEYESRINRLYGSKLMSVMKEKPCEFDVSRSNFLAYLGNMQWINRIYRPFNVVFRCHPTEINRSMLVNFVNAVNRVGWTNRVEVDHPLMKETK